LGWNGDAAALGRAGRPPRGKTLANKVYERWANLWLTLPVKDGRGPFYWVLERSTLVYELGRLCRQLDRELSKDATGIAFVRDQAHKLCLERPKVVEAAARLRQMRTSGLALALVRARIEAKASNGGF
jgi:hypothetical protein